MAGERQSSDVFLDVNAGRTAASPVAGRDTPFRLLLLGDFSGRASRSSGESGGALAKRRAVRVDRDDFNDVLEHMAPRLVLDDAGRVATEVYNLVFGDSVDFEDGHVTMSSPIGRALVNRGVGDVALLKLPATTRQLRIVEILTIHQLSVEAK